MGGKILLVASSFEETSLVTASLRIKSGVKVGEYSHYPLGLAYLHSFLESKGFETRTLFLNHFSFIECFSKFKEEIRKLLPDIVGFQLLTANRVSSYKLIRYMHKNYPSVKIVLGGIHATVLYRQLIKAFPYTTVIIGEGEITFSELAKELSKEKPCLEKIEGIAFIFSGKTIITKPRKLIADLDSLPFPKHEIFFDENRKRGNILTMRGCPIGCSFCCLKSISQGVVRKRSAKNVADEVEWMVNKFPKMDTIWIHDDSFLIDNQRVIEFCQEIIRRRIKISFICSARVRPISIRVLRMMEKANFKLVLLGVESGSEKILKSCHKGITKEDIIKAIKLFSKTKIMISIFLIIGLPGENSQTIKETIKFTKTLQKIKYFYFSEEGALLSVYPGTEIFQIAKEKGVIDDDYWLSEKTTPLYTAENSQEKLFIFKERLLNNISLDRIFTFKGFINQFMMTPLIIKFFFDNFKFILKNKAIVLKKIEDIFIE